MKHLCKLAFLPALFLLLTVNSANAAFPTEKQKGPQVSLVSDASSTETSKNSSTKSELKKELKALRSESAAKGSSGGGSKSKVLAAVLAFFLGGFGVHSFYMGQTKKGFLQLGLTAIGLGLYFAGIGSYISGAGTVFPTLALAGLIIIFGVSIWAFVDFIRILTGGLAPEEGFSD